MRDGICAAAQVYASARVQVIAAVSKISAHLCQPLLSCACCWSQGAIAGQQVLFHIVPKTRVSSFKDIWTLPFHAIFTDVLCKAPAHAFVLSPSPSSPTSNCTGLSTSGHTPPFFLSNTHHLASLDLCWPLELVAHECQIASYHLNSDDSMITSMPHCTCSAAMAHVGSAPALDQHGTAMAEKKKKGIRKLASGMNPHWPRRR